MLEQINQALMRILAAPANLSGPILFLGRVIADWAILLGPAALVLLWSFGRTRDRQSAVAACLSAVLALAFSAVVSAAIFHPRPFMEGITPNYLDHAVDSSFPSDHCALLFGLAFSLLISAPPVMPRIWIAVMALACLVGWSRIFLGAHFPLDIGGAAALALGSAGVFASRPGRYIGDRLTAVGELIYGLPARLLQSLAK